MKNILKTLLLISILSLIGSTDSQASHIAAGDMYYEHLGGQDYRIHLILYRDCNGIGLGSTQTGIALDSGCNFAQQTLSFDTTGVGDPLNGQVRHGLCPNQVANFSCQNPPPNFTIYQYWHYIADVTLPGQCANWKFYWQSCCRNGSIVNLQGPGGTGTRIFATLDNTIRANNSVILTADPIPYICINQAFQYLNSPIDPDLDSIVFEAASGSDNTGGYTELPVIYSPAPIAYTANTPIATTPLTPAQYSVDANTGTVSFTPTGLGQFVLAFNATEYDFVTKQKIGSVRRDVQVAVVGCTTAPPDIVPDSNAGGIAALVHNLVGAIDLSTPSSIVLGICPGETMSFDVIGEGDTLNNLVKTNANNAISAIGSSYTSNPIGGGNPVTGSFSWTPNATQIGDHVVNIFFTDSTCSAGQPIILNSKVTVLIKVLRGVSAGPDLPICAAGDSLLLPALGPEDITQWTWTELGNTGNPHGMSNPNIQNPFVRPSRTTTYVVNTNGQTACKNVDTITVFIDTSVTVEASASPNVLCEPGQVSLDATPDGPPPSYDCGVEGVGCAAPSMVAGFGTSLTSTSGVTPFLGGSNGQRTQMIFTQAELAAAGWVGPRRIDSLSFDITNKNTFGAFNMQIRMGCTFITDITSFIPGVLVKKVYENTSYQTTAGTNTFRFQNPYVWDGLSNIVVDVCFYNLNPIGVDEVASSTTAPNNQYISATSAFGGCQIPEVSGTSAFTISQSRPNIEFYACTLPPTAWQYRWSGPYLFDSTIKTPIAYVNDNPSKYVVFTRGGNGCLVWDTVEVTLSNHDVLVSPTNQTLCLNDRVRPIATGVGNQDGQRFRWYVGANASLNDLSCTDCATPEITANRVGINVYNVERTDQFGCIDTATITLEVLPLPTVVITNGDTAVVRFGESLQLLAEGSLRYSWTPSWGMNNPNISSPVIKPTETDLYTVNGLDENGCGNSDKIYIIVDYSRNLFIPTAFSPNGDGNNDRFRIANFGAQRVSEFRVYNRWGQEVFNAKDNRGWDGTYLGEDQGNGTYHYIIKAAFADGEVQTFKGDVVLVR